MRPDPYCERCRTVETMEHLLCKCPHYSQLLWIQLGEVITQYLNSTSLDYIPQVDIGQLNVIYNVPHRSFLLYIHDKLTRNALLILNQESKWDVVYRRIKLPPSARQVIYPPRLAVHLDSTLRQLLSYLQYIVLAKYKKAITALQIMQEINIRGP